ncbi:MAG: LPS translocon maturation chaperone LptM [Planctomycetota bacterium]
MRITLSASASLLSVSLLGGCGQTGPLYLPDSGTVVTRPRPTPDSPTTTPTPTTPAGTAPSATPSPPPPPPPPKP